MAKAHHLLFTQFSRDLSNSPPETSPGPPSPADEHARYLENLTIRLLEAHDHLDPPNIALIRKHLAADFRMVNTSIHDCVAGHANSVDAHIENIRNIRKAFPCLQMKPESATAKVNKSCKHATVFVTVKGCRAEKERRFNRESVSVMYYRCTEEEGKWVSYKHVAIRGGGDFLEYF